MPSKLHNVPSKNMSPFLGTGDMLMRQTSLSVRMLALRADPKSKGRTHPAC
jgi:hypothetical protein